MGEPEVLVDSVRDSVERLYPDDGERLWRAVVGFAGSAAVADDAVAEAYAQLLRRGTQVRRPRPWSASVRATVADEDGTYRGIRMHAIVGHSEIDAARGEEATAVLVNGLLPGLQAADGFVSATFVRSADGATGHSMVVFESEEAARAVADTAGDRLPADAPITIVSLEVCEVAASG